MIAPRTISRRQFLAVTAGAALVAFADRTLRDLPASATVDIYVVTSGPLRLRSGPGLTYSVLAELPVGTRMEVIDTGAVADGFTWVKVWVPSLNKTGFVAGEFIAKESTAPPVAGIFPIGSTVYVDSTTGGDVNLRSGPGLSYSVVKFIPNGTTGTILSGGTKADGYDWVQVSMLGVTGWMASQCLEAGTGSVPPVTPVTPSFAVGAGVVTTDDLNLRTAAGTSASVLAVLPRGTPLTVTGAPIAANGYTWYPVKTGAGATGWVAGAYLSATSTPSTPAFAPGSTVKVATDALNLRSAASLTATVLLVLPFGTSLTVTGAPTAASGYTWYPVKTSGGTTGWVAGVYLA